MDEQLRVEALELATQLTREFRWSSDENCWFVRVPDITGLVIRGRTHEHADALCSTAIIEALMAMSRACRPWPKPFR